jgi:hypothetical protein
MITHFNRGIKTWAAVDVIQTALAGTGCTRATSTAGSTRRPGDAAVAVEQRGTPVYRECRHAGWDAERGRQRASDGISTHAKLLARLVCQERSVPVATDGIAEVRRQRAQSDGLRGAGEPPSCAARQGNGPPAAADCFARCQGTDAISALPSAVDPFHAVVPGKYKLEFPKPLALSMHPSYTMNHC